MGLACYEHRSAGRPQVVRGPGKGFEEVPRLAIRVGPQARSFQDGDVTRHVWKMTGSTFDDLTLSPSVQI